MKSGAKLLILNWRALRKRQLSLPRAHNQRAAFNLICGFRRAKSVSNAKPPSAPPKQLTLHKEALQEVPPMLEQLLMIRGEPEPGSIGHKARAAVAKATGLEA